MLQRNYADLFAVGLEDDSRAYLKMVNVLKRERVAASLLR